MPNTVVKMPQLGESVSEGTIGRWLKKPGDRVQRDEPLLEVQTDKVNAEVPSPVAGVVQQLLQPEGATVAVHTDLVVIGDRPAEQAPAGPPPAPSEAEPAIGPEASPRVQGPEGVKPHRTPQEADAASP